MHMFASQRKEGRFMKKSITVRTPYVLVGSDFS